MRRELTKMIAFVVFTTLAGASLAGCTSDLCARNSDCKAGQECSVDGVCVMRTETTSGDDDSSTDASVSTDDASSSSSIDAE